MAPVKREKIQVLVIFLGAVKIVRHFTKPLWHSELRDALSVLLKSAGLLLSFALWQRPEETELCLLNNSDFIWYQPISVKMPTNVQSYRPVQGFSTLVPLTFGAAVVLFGGCLGLCRLFVSNTGLYPVATSSIHYPKCDNHNVSGYCCIFQGSKSPQAVEDLCT